MLFSPHTQTTLHYRIVTPMFLGGENQQTDPTQFRNASFKGALRFWWRALNWGRVPKEAGGEQEAALCHLHKREGDLFGLASDGKNSKQSRVQIQTDLQGATLKQPGMALQSVGYLLGQGLFRPGQGVQRQYLEGGELSVRLHFKPGTPEVDIASVEEAAIALGLLGGLGSRARRGLGSLALIRLERQGQRLREFPTVQDIKSFIETLDYSAPAHAPLSAFTQATRIDVSATKGKALDTLAEIGNELQMYRSFGKNGLVTRFEHGKNETVPAHPKFRSDHDNVRAAAEKGVRLQKLPDRSVFGLPHNYYFSSIADSGKKKFGITAENEGRRASPLLVHIHPLQDGKFVAIQTLLPGVFLPPDMKVEAKGTSKTAIPDISVNYAHITGYLDGFANKNTLRAPYHG